MGFLFAFVVTACAVMPASAERRVGYGGERWSVQEIFPEGAARDLAAAAARGDMAGIDRALKAGADVNFRGKDDRTPLWWATWDQNLAGFTRLLERGADPNIRPEMDINSRKYQPEPVMHMVAQAFWDSQFLKAALAHGGNPNLPSRMGGEPLSAAIQKGTRAHVDLLLAAGAWVDSSDPELMPGPMLAAIIGGRFEYVLMLLERGAAPEGKNRTGKDLAQLIGLFPYDPNSDQYVWRERVIRFLRQKGIEAYPPSNEGKRTKPLPQDLK